MPTGMRAAGPLRDRLGFLAATVLLATVAIASAAAGRAMQDLDGDPAGAGVRIVHGISDAGPLDVYIDGSLALIGIRFADTSGVIGLPGGEHSFSVVPTGSPPESAIASGTIALDDEALAYAALIGTSDSTNVGLFEVDNRPLEQGRARFRFISGVPDAGAITPTFTGGDALSEPLAFGDASQYASIDAGAYDLDLVDSATGTLLLTLPQTVLAEGTTTDLILVGQLVDGSVMALVQPTEVDVARVAGRVAQLYTGACGDPGSAAAELGVVRTGQGAAVGVTGVVPVAQGFGAAAIPFSTLVASPHAVVVTEDTEAGGGVVACGDIGGNLTDTGALVIALQSPGSDATGGVAVLAPALEDPGSTGVSVFVFDGVSAAAVAATPVITVD